MTADSKTADSKTADRRTDRPGADLDGTSEQPAGEGNAPGSNVIPGGPQSAVPADREAADATGLPNRAGRAEDASVASSPSAPSSSMIGGPGNPLGGEAPAATPGVVRPPQTDNTQRSGLNGDETDAA